MEELVDDTKERNEYWLLVEWGTYRCSIYLSTFMRNTMRIGFRKMQNSLAGFDNQELIETIGMLHGFKELWCKNPQQATVVEDPRNRHQTRLLRLSGSIILSVYFWPF